jgi:hypothetical protein
MTIKSNIDTDCTIDELLIFADAADYPTTSTSNGLTDLKLKYDEAS